MSFSSLAESSRRPAAVALRLLLWPVVILLLSSVVASTQDDGLAAGLLSFAVAMSLGFWLALADGLVLRVRPLVLVWSVSTVLVAVLLVFQPVVDFVLHGSVGESTWTETVQLALEDFPSSFAFFLGMVGAPVGLGAVVGSVVRRASRPRPSPRLNVRGL